MPVTIERAIDDDVRGQLLALYRNAFEPLRTLTATKQTLDTDEFSALLDYDATTIFLARSTDGDVTGYAVAVAELKLIPWINPEFFAERFPGHYADGRVIYIPTFLVDPDHQKGSTFMRLTRELAQYYGVRRAILF